MTAVKALVDFNVTKKNQTVITTHVLTELCAKMNLVQETLLASANLGILVKIVTLVWTLANPIHVPTEQCVKANSKEGSCKKFCTGAMFLS